MRNDSSAWRFSSRLLTAAAIVCPIAATGCLTNAADRITSKRFRDAPFHTMFTTEEPMSVLTREGAEGDERIHAMQRLNEPLSRGGSQTEQDAVLKILSDTATTDPQALCRVAAIEALGRFKDPRGAEIIVRAYQNAPINTLAATSIVVQAAYNPSTPGAQQAANFSLDLISRIQGQVMESAGKTQSPESKKLLIEVAAKAVKKVESKSAELDALANYDAEHYRFDIRLAAINALRYYANDEQVTRVLIDILRTERDTAIQNRCMSSLKEVTKKSLGNEPNAWLTAYDVEPTLKSPERK